MPMLCMTGRSMLALAAKAQWDFDNRRPAKPVPCWGLRPNGYHWSDIIHTGTFPITGLISFIGADNIFYPAGPVFGLYGFSFSDSNNDLVNISTYCTSATGTRYCAVEYVPASGDGPSQMGDFTVTPASVPGPIAGAGLPGLILACGGFVSWWRRRKKIA